jgi:thiamine transport system substrate-binding protein
MRTPFIRALLLICLLLGGRPIFAQQSGATTLTVVTHDSFAVSQEVLEEFEAETGITIRILRSGDAGTMLNQAILSKENPLGDVMYGVDNTFLSRALDADIFLPYESPRLKDVREEFLTSEAFVTPIDYGDVCLNYDVGYFQETALPLPQSLQDLVEPEYKGLLVTENPATSSPGLAFMLSTVAAFGTSDEAGEYDFLDFWADLVRNDVLIVDDWTDAYYGQFSGSSGDGQRPLVVSYASSPPVEVYFAEETLDQAPTSSIVEPGMCFRQIEYAGILAGTEHVEAAQQFIDFMLSTEFQEDMPLQMFVFPVIEDAVLPELFVQYAQTRKARLSWNRTISASPR